MLTKPQQQRYTRNILLPEIGELGQENLLQSKVLIIGAGGLGSSIIYYLAAAGVGKIGIVDDDKVELSNLQRQIIHNQENLGQNKAQSAKDKVALLNLDVAVETYQIRINQENLGELVQKYDLIIDATDNFAARFVINQICHQQQKTWVFGAVKGFLGQVSVFKSYQKNNPCFACFNPNFVDENFVLPMSEKGIFGAVAGNVGSMQAIAAIKELLNLQENLVGKILIFDFLKNNFRKVGLKKSPNCKVCQAKNLRQKN